MTEHIIKITFNEGANSDSEEGTALYNLIVDAFRACRLLDSPEFKWWPDNFFRGDNVHRFEYLEHYVKTKLDVNITAYAKYASPRSNASSHVTYFVIPETDDDYVKFQFLIG